METTEGTVPTVNNTQALPDLASQIALLEESPAVQEGLTNKGLQLDYEAISEALKSDSFVSTSLLQPIAGQAFSDGSPVEELRPACADPDCTAHEYFGADEELPVVGDVTREEFEELRDAVATLARAYSAILADLNIIDQLEARIELFNKNSAHKL